MEARLLSGVLLESHLVATSSGLTILLYRLVLRTFLQTEWLLAVVFIATLTAICINPWTRGSLRYSLCGSLTVVSVIALLKHFGLVAPVTARLTVRVLVLCPNTTDLARWPAGNSLLALIALAGKPLPGDRLLGG